ncbi:MAG: hypothetical protein ACFB6R_01000 [Alphaproteobacteria bacterium]
MELSSKLDAKFLGMPRLSPHRALLALAIGLAGCGPEGPSFECSPIPQRCLKLEEQTEAEGQFSLAFRNGCDRPVDLKVCFEDEASGADCRLRSALPPGERHRERRDLRLMGEGIQYFVRFADEARTCPFPENRRIQFP